MIDNIIIIFILASAVGTVSMTISKSVLFKPIRNKIKNLECPYCIGHWIALWFYIFYHPVLLNKIYILDDVVSYFVLVCFSTLWQLVIALLFKLTDEESN